ncbi:hypothetical protein CAOG_05220 [Capsaspora owczarzaki ATCC 30864]|uniref:Uncharacterized protein n=1 Tax=Capsaspora owczarzaki (strain ATCC 30864) TaxID=595528 RepID=A0A0D2VTL1_CAPO3|nr:hypothetical protein CAOG_05220 [Capsaspora owczarzaki ATCC 30864]KJE94597.1 hypothetical protein CAOG_005220 [Capsaspora owczarzaki ATCC 30864]|eukprot:XP_004346905.1 hypothetical protein CAOG_05220 [Capsaspora owczarzaki ATCC 30864]
MAAPPAGAPATQLQSIRHDLSCITAAQQPGASVGLVFASCDCRPAKETKQALRFFETSNTWALCCPYCPDRAPAPFTTVEEYLAAALALTAHITSDAHRTTLKTYCTTCPLPNCERGRDLSGMPAFNRYRHLADHAIVTFEYICPVENCGLRFKEKSDATRTNFHRKAHPDAWLTDPTLRSWTEATPTTRNTRAPRATVSAAAVALPPPAAASDFLAPTEAVHPELDGADLATASYNPAVFSTITMMPINQPPMWLEAYPTWSDSSTAAAAAAAAAQPYSFASTDDSSGDESAGPFDMASLLTGLGDHTFLDAEDAIFDDSIVFSDPHSGHSVFDCVECFLRNASDNAYRTTQSPMGFYDELYPFLAAVQSQPEQQQQQQQHQQPSLPYNPEALSWYGSPALHTP